MKNSPQPTPELTATSSTPGHTIGPFFHDALRWASSDSQSPESAHGSILIEGTVEDGSGASLPAWLLEAWVPQAVASETQAGLPAPGFRRLMSAAEGGFAFRVPPPAPGQPAAFITLFGLGLTRHFSTAVFLEAPTDEGNGDGLIEAVPAERRATLLAEQAGESRYRWTIRTQGDRETVFFEYR
jgi:protocatechuate 3,4-dioxygenase alpha subunit